MRDEIVHFVDDDNDDGDDDDEELIYGTFTNNCNIITLLQLTTA